MLDAAFNELDDKLTNSFVSRNFCRAILDVEEANYASFMESEAKAFPELVVAWMDAYGSQIQKMHRAALVGAIDGEGSLSNTLKDVVREVVRDSFPLIRQFQTTVVQMRKKRAGESFQEIVLRLLNRIDIPCQRAKGEVEAELGHTDLVVPDVKTARATPDKAIFMACQHTLAERWWANVGIASGGRRGYILTIDKRLGEKKANRLKKHNLIVYVRDDVKETDALNPMPWVRKLSDLPSDLGDFKQEGVRLTLGR